MRKTECIQKAFARINVYFCTQIANSMKSNRDTVLTFMLLIAAAALYRAMPDRIWGFAPHIAMAIFGGSVLKNRSLSFGLPVFSLFLSDLIYHVLYLNGLTPISGFYDGQWINYLLIGSLTLIGFFVKSNNPVQIGSAALLGPLAYFIMSNFTVWISGGGLQRPRTFTGLMQCYGDGLPFLQTSVYGTLFFSALLFGGFYMIRQHVSHRAIAS
jgi:hypothetical protein